MQNHFKTKMKHNFSKAKIHTGCKNGKKLNYIKTEFLMQLQKSDHKL